MSYMSDLDLRLQIMSELEAKLGNELQRAEITLNRLLCDRESFIRAIEPNKWDLAQYRLDDLQQKLADIKEFLSDIAPVESASRIL
jgi:hypothetical protein